MNRKMLITSAALIALSTTAMAADLPSRRAPPVFVPPPVFSWAGFYVGGQVGYGFGRDSGVIDASSLGAGLFPYVGTGNPKGVIGGAHVGYNFVFPSVLFGSALIAGIEGDVDGSNSRTTQDFFGALAPGANGLILNQTKNDIQGSIRGRIGFAFDRVLFYATGGVAFADFKSSYFATPVFGGVFPALPQSFSRTRVGYTVGGGVEYAITNNWSLRGEYRYSDFGSFSDPTTFFAGASLPVRHRETEQRVQAGFSYKFDYPVLAPVVARY